MALPQIPNPAGSKLAKQQRKGTVGLRHGAGGIVAQSIREIQRDNNSAKIANSSGA